MPDVKIYLKVQNCLDYIHMKGFLNNDKTCDFFPMQITLHVKQAKILKNNIFVLLRLQNNSPISPIDFAAQHRGVVLQR